MHVKEKATSWGYSLLVLITHTSAACIFCLAYWSIILVARTNSLSEEVMFEVNCILLPLAMTVGCSTLLSGHLHCVNYKRMHLTPPHSSHLLHSQHFPWHFFCQSPSLSLLTLLTTGVPPTFAHQLTFHWFSWNLAFCVRLSLTFCGANSEGGCRHHVPPRPHLVELHHQAEKRFDY